MKNNRFTMLLIAVLVIVAALAATLHLSTRVTADEDCILVEIQGNTTNISLSGLPYQAVQGSLVNGKGETREVNAQGISLSALLDKAGITEYTTVSVVADDSYAVDVAAEEVAESGKVFLVIAENELPELVVFGDSNSKRNVSGVVRLVIV